MKKKSLLPLHDPTPNRTGHRSHIVAQIAHLAERPAPSGLCIGDLEADIPNMI